MAGYRDVTTRGERPADAERACVNPYWAQRDGRRVPLAVRACCFPLEVDNRQLFAVRGDSECERQPLTGLALVEHRGRACGRRRRHQRERRERREERFHFRSLIDRRFMPADPPRRTNCHLLVEAWMLPTTAVLLLSRKRHYGGGGARSSTFP
jgi:hypothetical protein